MIYIVSRHGIILFLFEHLSVHPCNFSQPARILFAKSFKFFFKQSERTVFIIVIYAVELTSKISQSGFLLLIFFIMVSIAAPNLI